MTDIRAQWPPNIVDIRAVLPVTDSNIFAYGDVIYNPGGGHLSLELIAHEQVHFRQQGGKPATWWKKFLKSPDFRLEQEMEAHRAEYREFCRNHRDRNHRSRYLRELGRRLAAPMYGGLITVREAMVRIVV